MINEIQRKSYEVWHNCIIEKKCIIAVVAALELEQSFYNIGLYAL